jgi:hypothetical protein
LTNSVQSLITFYYSFYNQFAGGRGVFHGDLKIVSVVNKDRVTVDGAPVSTLIPPMETVKEVIPGQHVRMILIVEKEVSQHFMGHSSFFFSQKLTPSMHTTSGSAFCIGPYWY